MAFGTCASTCGTALRSAAELADDESPGAAFGLLLGPLLEQPATTSAVTTAAAMVPAARPTGFRLGTCAVVMRPRHIGQPAQWQPNPRRAAPPGLEAPTAFSSVSSLITSPKPSLYLMQSVIPPYSSFFPILIPSYDWLALGKAAWPKRCQIDCMR